MKKLIYFLPLLLLASCSTDASKTAESQTTDTLMINNVAYSYSKIDKEAFDAIKANQSNKSDNSEKIDDPNVTRINADLLKFKLKNGKEISLQSNNLTSEQIVEQGLGFSDSEGNPIIYENKFLKTIPEINAWLIEESYYEGVGYFLMDKNNGKTTYVYSNNIAFSPNKSHFVVYSCNLDTDYTANGIELFEISGDKIKLVWSKTLTEWGPNKLKWKNEKSIVIEQLMANTRKFSYIELEVLK